ncbi:hypothetical protein CHARACLAT_031025 [Characodon lateralis]|uniref:Selenoprotein O n=1 Tax=Characodon lateralis TaxID=208331 RepID=A0ABU7CSV5_9TELE|nr:hypothetical protein [Characodon lateralis]
MESSQSASSALEPLTFNNTALKRLPVDVSGQPGSRTVPGACFSRIGSLQPLLRPRIVALSHSALFLLGLSVQDVLDDPLTPEYFSEPAAHCYCGHQFGLFASQLGDAAVMYLGEVESDIHGRWEIQVKGAGVTPYSRRRLARDFEGTSDLHFVKQERLRVMNSTNPRVVLRNYIAQNAIQAADKGDFSVVKAKVE